MPALSTSWAWNYFIFTTAIWEDFQWSSLLNTLINWQLNHLLREKYGNMLYCICSCIITMSGFEMPAEAKEKMNSRVISVLCPWKTRRQTWQMFFKAGTLGEGSPYKICNIFILLSVNREWHTAGSVLVFSWTQMQTHTHAHTQTMQAFLFPVSGSLC